MTKRVFIAVNFPEKVKEQIEKKLLSKIPEKGMKPVKKENLHITIAFLGYLNEQAIDNTIKALEFAKKTKKFPVELTDIGHFKKRIIWLGASKGSKELIKINKKTIQALEIQDKRFHPHATLARNKSLKSKKVSELLQKLDGKKFKEEFTAKSLDVMESVLKKKGPIYSVLKKMHFK